MTSSGRTRGWTKMVAALGTALAAALAGMLWILASQAEEAMAQEAVPEVRTLYFELAVEGEPPAETTFTAIMPGANFTELTDPDGDGVYTGSLEANLRNYPRCVPVQVFGDTPDELSYVIRDEPRFCFEDGDTFSASYSFAGGTDAGDLGGDGFSGELIVGTYGDDLLRAGAGDDLVIAEAGADEVYGGEGDDALYAAYDVSASEAPNAPASPDLLYGGEGDDFIDSADAAGAADAVYCGPGADLVEADAEDFAASDCEEVIRF